MPRRATSPVSCWPRLRHHIGLALPKTVVLSISSTVVPPNGKPSSAINEPKQKCPDMDPLAVTSAKSSAEDGRRCVNAVAVPFCKGGRHNQVIVRTKFMIKGGGYDNPTKKAIAEHKPIHSQNINNLVLVNGENYLNLIVDATDISPEEEYDYIVVGGSTAGCPLAATLSSNYSVLLLERGGLPYEHPDVLSEEKILVDLYEANDRDSPAQPFTSEDGIPSARGRVLGGSSTINVGIYSRADSDFYSRTGIKWDMGAVKKAYEWVEESVVFGTDKLTTWESSVRDALLESNIGPDNGFTLDHVVGAKVTGATFDERGRRHGAVELLNKANPENLRVIVNATVQRLNFSSSESSGFDLLICALGSPQLLLLSGVGPRPHLTSLNIPVILDQPFVGQFMYDPPRSTVNLVTPFPISGIGSHAIGISRDGFSINDISGATPFYSPVSEILFPDPSPPINLSIASIVTKLTRTQSSGSLQLASATNISVNPNVRFNYFSNPEDLSRCSNMIRYIATMISTPSMEAYKFRGPNGEKSFLFVGTSLAENESDGGTLKAFCRKTLRTIYHYHGGCTVGKVVDGDLKAIGIKALRVVDGSTFPTSPGTNPQATLMMLGRYIGLKIKEERSA
ncbi:hypothetical protein RJ639_022364 [Escallonia herrerae]|uniref:Glucose-methanol-choline oxidoreductase N-terminal domain-containing protein n=1 Tax=Escallonia herrerae TaxID=1293975 RepID=A0AA89AFT0_9ASTE|nr:hypothetical protein RJ639_022364 [Escallonia herrerae]